MKKTGFCVSSLTIDSKLTPEMKEAAELYGIKSISIEDVKWLLKCEQLPSSFFQYAKKYAEEIDDMMRKAWAKRVGVAFEKAAYFSLEGEIYDCIYNKHMSPEDACREWDV